MSRQIIEELAQNLSHRRSSLLQDVAEGQEEMKAILEQQESELEESAQKDRITRVTSRLNERDRQKVREIDGALDRMAAGIYEKCGRCGREIGVDRLRALPTTTLCINCAAARESRNRTTGSEEPSERLPVRDQEAEGFGETSGINGDKD
ncbi:MAG: TraR/DksA family transcriptional regulator [Gammaproteobacteria bacterium]